MREVLQPQPKIEVQQERTTGADLRRIEIDGLIIDLLPYQATPSSSHEDISMEHYPDYHEQILFTSDGKPNGTIKLQSHPNSNTPENKTGPEKVTVEYIPPYLGSEYGEAPHPYQQKS